MASRKKASDLQLAESYNRLNNLWMVAEEFSMCGQSVHERLVKMGIKLRNPKFTEKEKDFLIHNYNTYLLKGKLSELALELGRSKPFICRKARALNLTNINRSKKLLANYIPPCPDWNKRPHPRGMKGKKHTPETLALLSIRSIESQSIINNDKEKRYNITRKTLETKHKNGVFVNARPHTTWKSGWREIGGKRKYFRSMWEANYARYLDFLKTNKQIIEWEHEPDVFWFDGIKRGCVSYLPDFKVTELNGAVVYHEVKGWMDDRSKTKIKRMCIYHPEAILIIIDAKWFKSNNKKLSTIIKGWEISKRK